MSVFATAPRKPTQILNKAPDTVVFPGRRTSADAAAGAIDALVESGALIDQATDDHDVHKHYANGLEVIDDFAGKQQRIPERAIPSLRALGAPCAVRSRCRLRLLVRQ